MSRLLLRTRRLHSGVLLAIILLALAPAGLGAQPSAEARPGVRLLGEADALVEEGRVEEGLELLEEHLARFPGNYHARWRAARAALVLGVLARGRAESRDAFLERAVRHAEEAVRVEPGGIDGLYWRAAAKGRLSLHQDAARAASLAQDVWDDAQRVLEMDPRHAGAHNALGRLNLEVMMLPGWKRTLARLVAGGALGKTSWKGAEDHLVRAVQLDPGQVLYRRDLGQLYLRTGRPGLARDVLEQVVAMPPRRTGDEVFQEEAGAMLRKLEAESGGG